MVEVESGGRVSTFGIGTLQSCEGSAAFGQGQPRALVLVLLAVSVSKSRTESTDSKNGMSNVEM
jgi:hypothetical protein